MTTQNKQKKLPGGEISTPVLPNPQAITVEKRRLIASGQPCSPYTLTKRVLSNDGDLVTKQMDIPLLELRRKYMRLMTDNLSKEEIVAEMYVPAKKDLQDLERCLHTLGMQDLQLSCIDLAQASNMTVFLHIPCKYLAVHAIYLQETVCKIDMYLACNLLARNSVQD